MQRPILPLFEPEVLAAGIRRPDRASQTTAVRHVVFDHVDIQSERGSANEIYALLNVVEGFELVKSYMIEGLYCRADIDFGYVAEMCSCDGEEAEAAARYLGTLLPAGSTIEVILDVDHLFILSSDGHWSDLGKA